MPGLISNLIYEILAGLKRNIVSNGIMKIQKSLTIHAIFYIWLIFLLLSGCKEKQQVRILKGAHNFDQTHSVAKAYDFLSSYLADISGGRLLMAVYPNGQLGTDRECLELLQIGSIDITKVSSGVLENFVPEFKVLGLPYIFKDRSHQFNILDGPVGRELLLAGEKYWLRGLGYYDSGSRSFYSKDKPIETPSDLRGLKIRTMESPTAMNMVKQMGGAATPISFGELYTALQAGVVDGAENNPPSLYLTRHYEICKYYSLDEHTSLPDVLLISTHTWNSLTVQQQAWLNEAADASVVYQRKLWKEAEIYALEQLTKEGVKISYPDKTPFIEIVEPLYRQYENEPEIAELITRIKETN